MVTERIVTAISSLSGFDMLENVRAHNVRARDMLAFEAAMQTGQTHMSAPLTPHAVIQDTVIPEHLSLPSPQSLLAERVQHLQASLEPSWMEAVPPVEQDAVRPLEQDAFQRGLDRLENVLHTASSDALSQKTLFQLQFAMAEMSAYKEIGLQISKKSASNLETVLKQQE